MSAQEVPVAGPEQGDSVGTQHGSPSAVVKKEPSSSNGQVRDSNSPAEICVVIGESRNAQTLGLYACGICGKKYKYYNCFQTHVRGHRESDAGSGEGGSQTPNNSFRYTCDICGKKYKYYSCFQEHRDLHAVDDPYDQVVIPVDDLKEEEAVEPFVKIGPKTGSYVCEFCGKQYKYFNPYQEHVALHAPIKSAFCRKMESKVQSSLGETNSSQNSSGTMSPLVSSSFPALQTDNENHTKAESPKSTPAPTAQEHLMKSPPSNLRNNSTNRASVLPEKERQQVAERLLRVMCMDLGALSVLSGKDFLKLAQTLVDTGARHGAYPLPEALGDVSSLALQQLPRMYNQVKVKVTCALGSSKSLGIAVTCHAQTGGPKPCHVLTAHQLEGVNLRHYVLGAQELDLRERDGGEQLHHWVQNVLSEFVMPEVHVIYVTEPQRPWVAPFCGRVGACLRCAGCSLGAVVQAVLGRKSLQTRGLHELAELLSSCRDVAGAAGLSEDGSSVSEDPTQNPAPPPPCWDQTTETLLKVHERFEQICEVYGQSKVTAPLLQGLNKHLLGTLAALLAPIRQAAMELSADQRPTLQLVLPAYLRLEKLFTTKASEAGAGSKICHYFLEALKENFKVERLHQVAMVLDPQLKLRPVPAYQHDDIIAKVVEAVAEMREGVDDGDREVDPPVGKRGRMEGRAQVCSSDEQEVRKEVFQYLSEPLFQATPNLFQYWSSVMEKYPRLARLALWLLAVPAVGMRGGLAAMCDQAVAMRRQRQVTVENMNKLIFLKSNMA